MDGASPLIHGSSHSIPAMKKRLHEHDNQLLNRSPLIISNTNFRSVITAIRATVTLKERILCPVVRPAIRVENSSVRFVVEVLVTELTQFIWGRPNNVGFMHVQNG